MESHAEELTLDEMLQRMTELVGTVEQADEQVREPMLELLDYLEAWHREGITRMAMALPPEALASAREDPVVAHLLDTYLAEEEDEDPEAAIEEALEEIRPYVHSHGGEMEVIEVTEDGVVTLRLMGSCDGCPSSMVTLNQGVEQILRQRWPGFRELRVEGDDQPAAEPKLLQIQSLKRQ